jgi:hypothetical protein
VTDRLCARKGYQHLTWFPEAPNLDAKVKHLIAICNLCPSQAACLADAEARRETDGVWGGKHFAPRKRRPVRSLVNFTEPWPAPWTGTRADFLENAS